jgi:hypothetical protein
MFSSAPPPQVGRVNPADLVDARLQAHHAAQLVVALGISYLPARDDDSHTNLEWVPELEALAGRLIPGRHAVRGALRIADPTLLILDDSSIVSAGFPLGGRTIEEAYRWLGARMEHAGADRARLTSAKHYSIPQHPVARGAPFAPANEAAAELARYYAGAEEVLTELARAHSTASEVRCWPHHFDIATRITLASGRTVGAGLSPGDGSYAEPYYYVTPYPHPQGDLPRLPHGFWHSKEWVGAVLPASHLAKAANQGELIRGFLNSSVVVSTALLQAGA